MSSMTVISGRALMPDREGDGADAAVDVKLSAALLELNTDLKASVSVQPTRLECKHSRVGN
jgi:hypothetical protein